MDNLISRYALITPTALERLNRYGQRFVCAANVPPLRTYSALNHFAVIQTPTAAKYFFFYIYLFSFFQFVLILNGKFDFFLRKAGN